MTNAAEMQIVVELKDKASTSLKSVDRSFSSTAAGITKGVAKMAAGFALLMGAAAIGGTILAVKKSISVFQEFESAIANAASVTGATGEAFEATKKNITEVSKILGETTVFSASEAANAFYDLASAGYDVANMTEKDLVPILDIAAATQTDLTKATEVVTSTLGQFGLGIESTQRIADVFAKTIGSSKATIEKLEAALRYVGPVANAMGMEIEEVNAILGHLYDAGFRGEQAGTALRAAFSRLLNPTKAMKDTLDGLGVTLEEINPETNDFADVLDTLTEAGMGTNDAMVLFGVEAAPAMLALLDSTDGIREMEVALKDAGGTAERMARQQLDTLKGSLALMKSALEGVAITIGGKVAPHLRALVEKFTEFIPIIMDVAGDIWQDLEPALKKLWDKFKDIYPSIKEVGTELINRLKPAFDNLKSAFDSIIIIGSSLISGFSNNETAMGSLTAVINIAIDTFNWFAKAISGVLDFLAKHPVIAAIVVGAILLMVAPILKIIAVIAILATAWNENWFGIKDTVLRIVGLIVDYLEWYFKHLEILWSKHGDTIMAAASLIWETIKTVVGVAIEGILLVINVILDIIEGDWEGAWNRIKEYLSTTFNKIEALSNTWKDVIKEIFSKLWEKLKEWVYDFADKTWDKIKTWISNVKQKFIDWKDDILETVQGWYDTIVGYFDFSKIEVKWPSLTLPSISEPGYEKYDVHERALLPHNKMAPHDESAPHYKYDRAGYDATAPPPHDKSTPHDESAPHYKYDRAGYDASAPSYKKGGPIPEDMNVDVHKGEYVVPKAGALVMGGSSPKDGHVQMTYNIGTVNGVDDLEKLLEKHDRDLYRRLVSLV